MNIKELQKQLLIYIKYLDNMTNNKNHIPSKKEINSAAFLRNIAKSNSKVDELLIKLGKEMDYEKKSEIVNRYLKFFLILNDNNKIKKISLKYGVNYQDIMHKVLNNGKIIYCFFDKNNNFKIIEDNNSILEGNINEYNLSSIKELKYKNLDSLDLFKLRNLKPLISKIDVLKLNKINIDNQIAIDRDGNVFEVFFDSVNNETKIQLAKSYDLETNEININKKIELTDTQEFILSEVNDPKYNEMLDLIEKEFKTYGFRYKINPKKVYKKIIEFYKNPEKLNELSGKIKIFYEKMLDVYSQNNNFKRKSSEESPKIYMGGYVNIFIVSIITILILLVLGIIYRLK